MSHSSLPVALLASHPPCGSLWAAPKAPLGPRFPSGQFAALARPGKRLLLPILPAGLTMSRAMELDSFLHLLERARARLFPPSKWAGLFPSAAYRRSTPRSRRVANLPPCRLGCFDVAGRFCGVDKWVDVLFPQSAVGIRSPCRLGCFGAAYSFLQRKRPAWFQSHAGLFKRAMRPVAEWRSLHNNKQGAAPDPRAARPAAERR